MNIVQIILKLLGGGDTIGKIATMLGLNQDQATKAINAAVPAMLAGITGAASKPGGATALASALSKQDTGQLDNIGGMLAGPNAVTQGSSMLSDLLGGEGLGQIGGILSKFTGMGQDVAGKLLGLLAPVVMGALGKQSQGLDASGIASLLTSQKDNIASALPSGLGSMLSSAVPGLSGLLGSASGAADSAVRSAANFAHGAGREVEKAGSSAMKWLIPAILAILAILLLPRMCRKATDDTKNVTEGAGEVISAATDDTKFVSAATDMLKTATDSVASIKDEASASAALPKLRELTGKIGGLESMLAKLPASVQSTVRATLKPLIEKLREAAQPVLAMPVIGAQVKPVLDELFSQLEKLVPAY